MGRLDESRKSCVWRDRLAYSSGEKLHTMRSMEDYQGDQMKPIRYIRWRIAWWRWFLTPYAKWGDPMYSKGEQRTTNLDRIHERWEAREPKREDYGI